MASTKIIERLRASDWIINCETEHELALVFNACLDANMSWSNTVQAPFVPDDIERNLPIIIGSHVPFGRHRLYWEVLEDFDDEISFEDITDWFFEELRSEQ